MDCKSFEPTSLWIFVARALARCNSPGHRHNAPCPCRTKAMDLGPGILEDSFECFKKMRRQIRRLHERLASDFKQNRVEQITGQAAKLRHKLQTD